MLRALIFGAPASGKGTISARIVEKFGVAHISSGDLLRQEVEQQSELGKKVEVFMKTGKYVPDNLVLELILKSLSDLKDRNWLLDGFPRTRHQGEVLMEKYKINLTISLEVPLEEILKRVKGRWVHLPSGRVYNDTFNAPKVPRKDDLTGEDLVQRPDDSPEAVKSRLQLYKETTEPLLSLFEQHKVLKKFKGNTSDEMWPGICEEINKVLKLQVPCPNKIC